MSYYLAAAAIATSVYSAYSSSKSAKDQAKGEQERFAALRRMFGEQQPGAAYLGQMAELAEFELPRINPLDYKEEGFDLTADAMDFMRAEAETTFEQTVGAENIGLFNEFLTDNLERANFDFSSLPPEITRTLEGSALARAVGGPAGLAENLSVENKLRLQQQSEQSAFKALGFRQSFMPDTLNPIDSVFRLAEFELQNNQQQLGVANLQLNALGAASNLELQRFGLEAGYTPGNFAGIGAAANANTAAALSQGLMTASMLYGQQQGGNTYGMQTSSATNAASTDWRTSASGQQIRAQNSSPTTSSTIYYRG